jgi:hypothetical protein
MTGEWQQGPQKHQVKLIKGTDTAGDSAISYQTGDLSSSPAGIWVGKLVVAPMELAIRLKIGKSKDGSWAGALDSPDQGAKDIAADKVTVTGTNVVMEWPLMKAEFKGDLTGSNELSGTWVQMGRSSPFKLERAGSDGANAEKPLNLSKKSGDITGTWLGKIEEETVNLSLRIQLRIGRDEKGAYAGFLDSLDQGASGLPISTISFESPDVKLEWKGIGASFIGKLEGGKLVGEYKQGPKGFPITFEESAESATR